MTLPHLAQRLNEVQESATVALAQRAASLRRQGIDILAFGVGQPDFPTPDYILKAAGAALSKSSHYTEVRGMLELRQAISDDSKKRRGGISHRPEDVVVSVGAKHALFNLALALYDPGDEVIIPAPYWVSYPEQVKLVGAKPVIVPTLDQDNFILTPKALEQAITSRTKALVLCTPSNPTGAAYTPSDLKARKLANWRCNDFENVMASIPAPGTNSTSSNRRPEWGEGPTEDFVPEQCQ